MKKKALTASILLIAAAAVLCFVLLRPGQPSLHCYGEWSKYHASITQPCRHYCVEIFFYTDTIKIVSSRFA